MSDASERSGGEARGVWCVWCGLNWPYKPGDDIGTIYAEMKRHDQQCPDNPLVSRAATAERERDEAEERALNYSIELLTTKQGLEAETERADAATRRAEDAEARFDSLCNELEQALKMRGDWLNTLDRRGAALIQSIGLALDKRERRAREIEQAAGALREAVDRLLAFQEPDSLAEESDVRLRKAEAQWYYVRIASDRLRDLLDAPATEEAP